MSCMESRRLEVFAGLNFQELTPCFQGEHGVAMIGSGLPIIATMNIGTRSLLLRSFKPRHRTILLRVEGQRLVYICMQNSGHSEHMCG